MLLDGISPRNRLLAAVPPSELERLRPHLEPVLLKRRQTLQESNLPVQHAYFIENGAAALMSKTRTDGPVGAGLVGRIGIVGLPIVLGTMRSPIRCVVQIPGDALRISAGDLRQAMERSQALRQILLNYVQAIMVQNMQLVLCSTRHLTEQRLARWLLLARDRLDTDEICVTHALVGKVLGVRRASVTDAIGKFEDAGALRRDRGCITLLDRAKLEQACCECYRLIRAEYDRLIPSAPATSPGFEPYGSGEDRAPGQERPKASTT